jgi:hypothetical protein
MLTAMEKACKIFKNMIGRNVSVSFPACTVATSLLQAIREMGRDPFPDIKFKSQRLVQTLIQMRKSELDGILLFLTNEFASGFFEGKPRCN